MQEQSIEKKIRDNLREIEEVYNNIKKFKMDNYAGLFTQEIKELENSTKLMDASFNTFKHESKEMDQASLEKSFVKIQTEFKNYTSRRSDLGELIIERKKNDFLKGGFFNEKRGEKFYSIVSADLPESHNKEVEVLKNKQNKIVYERELGNFPMEAIEEHEKLLRKAHKNLSNFIYFKMDRNSESTKKLKRSLAEFEKFTSFPVFKIEGSDNFDTSRNLGDVTGNNPFGAKGHGLPPLKNSPQVGGFDFLFYGTIAVLTLLAGRYISRQLNTQTKEKPVEEKFNPEDLKIISPLFGNKNIEIKNQNVYFNNFSSELYKDIKNFFPDSDKDINASIKDKGLTLTLSKDLSAKKGNEVFSKFFKQFESNFVKEFKDISKRKDDEEKLIFQKSEIRDLKELINNNIGDRYNIQQNPKKAGLIREYLNSLDNNKALNLDDLKFISDNSKKLFDITNNEEDKKSFEARLEKYFAENKRLKNPSSNPVTPNATATVIDARSPG
jgi:hypothetical protein